MAFLFVYLWGESNKELHVYEVFKLNENAVGPHKWPIGLFIKFRVLKQLNLLMNECNSDLWSVQLHYEVSFHMLILLRKQILPLEGAFYL